MVKGVVAVMSDQTSWLGRGQVRDSYTKYLKHTNIHFKSLLFESKKMIQFSKFTSAIVLSQLKFPLTIFTLLTSYYTFFSLAFQEFHIYNYKIFISIAMFISVSGIFVYIFVLSFVTCQLVICQLFISHFCIFLYIIIL